MFLHSNCRNGSKYAKTDKTKEEWTEMSWHNNVYNVNISVKTRLEHGSAIEYTHFQ